MSDALPEGLRRSLIVGPSMVTSVEWHSEIASTNARAAELAADGAPEGQLVAADVQTAGRGRHGRPWQAPAGSSLMWSLLVRPKVPTTHLGLLPLLTGLAVAETIQPFIPSAEVTVKWPNDVLITRGVAHHGHMWHSRATPPAQAGAPPSLEPARKVAGILVEGVGDGAAVVGVGTNTDWRGIQRPEGAGQQMISVAEAAGGPVDRWRLLAAMMGVFGNRYAVWQTAPAVFLTDYRERSATLGQRVRIMPTDRDPVEGTATGIAATGALEFTALDGTKHTLHAGDVQHLRPA